MNSPNLEKKGDNLGPLHLTLRRFSWSCSMILILSRVFSSFFSSCRRLCMLVAAVCTSHDTGGTHSDTHTQWYTHRIIHLSTSSGSVHIEGGVTCEYATRSIYLSPFQSKDEGSVLQTTIHTQYVVCRLCTNRHVTRWCCSLAGGIQSSVETQPKRAPLSLSHTRIPGELPWFINCSYFAMST